MRFEPESSNNLDDEFLIILTFDPSGMVRVTTLGERLGAPPYRLEARRSKRKAASIGKALPA